MEMHGQAHAFHLFQIRDKGFAAVHRNIDIHFIQSGAAQPVHKGIIIGFYLNILHLGTDCIPRGFQQGHTAHTAGPVVADLTDHLACMVTGGNNANQRFVLETVRGFYQQLFEQAMGRREQEEVKRHDPHQKIAGILQNRFGQCQKSRIDHHHQQVGLDGKFGFLPAGTLDNVFRLVKTEKCNGIGQHQQNQRLNPIQNTVRQQLPHNAANDQPCQNHTGGQSCKVC